MSELAANQTLQMVRARGGYPVIASHTGFRETGFGTWTGRTGSVGALEGATRTPTPWRDGDSASAIGFKSADVLTSERHLSASQVRQIRDLGGLVGIGTGARASPRAWPATGKRPIVPDCDGSTKSWVQNYRYAIEAMGGKGIALGTDFNGYDGAMGPRFGTFACGAALGDDHRRNFVIAQARAQENGVRYAQPIRVSLAPWNGVNIGFSKERFSGMVNFSSGEWPGALEEIMSGIGESIWRDLRSEFFKKIDDERNIWRAMAWFKSGQAPNGGIPFGCDIDKRGNERDAARFAWGFAQPTRPGDDCGTDIGDLHLPRTDTRSDAKAAWDTAHNNTNEGSWQDRDRTLRAQRIWNKWTQMEGANLAMQRAVTGERDFDFNLDGLAHYGLLPDMIQDAKNVGLSADELTPLFRGAEDYVAMWERIEGFTHR
jgi:hypothetical protein